MPEDCPFSGQASDTGQGSFNQPGLRGRILELLVFLNCFIPLGLTGNAVSGFTIDPGPPFRFPGFMASNDLILSMGSAFRGAMDMIRLSMPRKDKQSTLALSILIHVERQGGISQGELGRILRRDPMTMSQAVRALQNAGLVTSQPDTQDRRIKRLNVTRKGKTLGQSMAGSEGKLLTALTRAWGKSRVNQFAKDLAEFNDLLTSLKP